MIFCSPPWLRLFSHSAPAQALTAGTILALSTKICYAVSLPRTDLPSRAPACPAGSWGRAFCSNTWFCEHFLLGSDYVYSFISVCYVGTCVCMFECVCASVFNMCVIHTHACTVTWGQQRASDLLELSWRFWSPFLPYLFLFLVLLGVILGLLFFKFSVLIIWKFHLHI